MEEYIQSKEMSSNQGTLYSVSQRVPNVNASFSSLCQTEGGYPEQSAYSNYASDIAKDSSSEVLSDKQANDATTASVSSSSGSNPSALTGTAEPMQGIVFPICVYLHNQTALIMTIEDTPSATCDKICQAILNSEEVGLNKQLGSQIFRIWMCSSLLELQLKPTNKPYEIRRSWRHLVEQYSHDSWKKKQRDEPIISFQRNVFFPQASEEKIKDQKILELLYEEARHNILLGRYPCEVAHYIMLGGIQARIELGAYNPQVHSTHYFREEQSKYLPVHVRKSSAWTWFPVSSKNSAEVRLLEQFKRIPISATNRKLMRKYLEFCWSLPCYGSAFFEGQIEQPVRGLTTLLTHQDLPVWIGINSRGIYIIDEFRCTLLLGLRFEELSWDYARPSKEDDPNCLPCLFLQFIVVENGARVSKILQVFSRQAVLMDTLISMFVNQINKAKSSDDVDRAGNEYLRGEGDTHAASALANSNHTLAPPSLTNKLNKLTLGTFNEDGRCIGQMGSWSFSF